MNRKIIIAIPLAFALLARFVFGVSSASELFTVMSVSFLLCVPTIMGLLTVYFSNETNAKSNAYKIFMPWIPVFFLMLITLAFAWEGWACWLMVMPLFLLGASFGGFLGGFLKFRNKNKLSVSLLALLPYLIAPIESKIGAIPGTYRAYTSIDIQADADKIWDNVTVVYEIPAESDKGYLTNFLGFPRPVKAELNYKGVGAYRKAIFTNGLTFHETVSEYVEKSKMVFNIKANPYEIPSTTLDEHVVIGGKFFDVLTGTYELEQIDNQTYRLHLYSHFKLSTTFNFYASWWGKWIMQDIQNNILQVVKSRSESQK